MKDCLFCKIIQGDIPGQTVYEDEHLFIFLDINPVSKGHMLFVPKNHARNLLEGSREDAVLLMRAVYDLAPGILRSLGASGFNLGLNHGEDAGQEVFHTHLHFMPRYAGEPRAFNKSHPSQDELKQTADEVRKGLEGQKVVDGEVRKR